MFFTCQCKLCIYRFQNICVLALLNLKKIYQYNYLKEKHQSKILTVTHVQVYNLKYFTNIF